MPFSGSKRTNAPERANTTTRKPGKNSDRRRLLCGGAHRNAEELLHFQVPQFLRCTIQSLGEPIATIRENAFPLQDV